MKFIVLIFFISLLFGTVSGISLAPGVTLYAHDIALVLLFFASLIALSLKKMFVRPRLLLPISGFIITGIVSLVLNTFRFPSWQIGQSSLYLLRWTLYAGIYVVVVQTVASSAFWLWGLFGVGAGFALLGLIQYFLYPSLRNLIYLGWDPHYWRLFSTLLDPNFAGIILVLAFLLGIYLWRSYQKHFLFPVLTFLLLALYLTFSRSSYLAFIASLGYLVSQLPHWRGRGLIAIVIFLLVIVVVPKPGGDTLRLDRMVTTIARVENWQQSIARIGESPIFGFGFNTLRFVNPRPDSEIASKADAGVDNSMLFIFLTTGVLGFIAYCNLFYKQCTAATLFAKHKKHALLGHIFIACGIAIIIHSMFINSLFYPWVMIWMWILTGIVESTLRGSLANPFQGKHSG